MEEDYLDRANVDVIKGEVRGIDLAKRLLMVKGHNEPITFDKILVAWGASKKRLQ